MVPGGRWSAIPADVSRHNRQTKPGPEPGLIWLYMHPGDEYRNPWAQPMLVRDFPSWSPMDMAGSLSRSSGIAMYGVQQFGLTEQEANAIASMDPIAGVAPAGTSVFSLPYEKRIAWLGNLYLIYFLRHRNDRRAIRYFIEVARPQYSQRLGVKREDERRFYGMVVEAFPRLLSLVRR